MIVTESAAAAVADTSVLKGDIATTADKCTENWQTYLKAPLVPLNSLLSSVECQRCSASQSSAESVEAVP